MDNGKLGQGETGVSQDNEAILHLKEAVALGKDWFVALLESIAMWKPREEEYNGRKYCYLISGEAFDWLLLAERLLNEVGDAVPQDKVYDLLFHSRPPREISNEDFHRLIGPSKYRAHLNYFYGITVEEALLLAVEEDVRKEQRAIGIVNGEDLIDEVYNRVYGASKAALLSKFRKEKGYPAARSMQFHELKEFTYWLFKYRVNNSDKARIASDTSKALKELERHYSNKHRAR